MDSQQPRSQNLSGETLLSSNPEKTLLPKIQFFHSRGFSTADIAQILSVCPEIFHSSLENQLIPTFHAIQNLLPSDYKVISAIKRVPKLILSYYRNFVIPNIKLLKETGLPQSRIVWLLSKHPMVLLISSDRFSEIVQEVRGLGLNPVAKNFAVGVHVMRSLGKSNWEKKFDIYKKWGWSEEETIVAFGKYPWCMIASEEKIEKMMDFYINKMGQDSSFIAQYPVLIFLSLEKRVRPRCSVMQFLLSKGLIKLTSLATPLKMSEELFLQRFVIPYKEEAPHLLKLYQEKLNVAKYVEKERQG